MDANGGDRPNLLDPSILGRTIGHPDDSRLLLPRTAFAFIQPTDRAGNLGRNVFRKGGISNVNASISRPWSLGSERQLLFRAESINLFNTPQFAEPGRDLVNPNFGQITNTLNDGRDSAVHAAVQFLKTNSPLTKGERPQALGVVLADSSTGVRQPRAVSANRCPAADVTKLCRRRSVPLLRRNCRPLFLDSRRRRALDPGLIPLTSQNA